MSEYPIVVRKLTDDEGGGYFAFAPDLTGCVADGDSADEAVVNIAGAIAEWLDEARRLNRDIPAPGNASRRLAKERSDMAELIRRQDRLIRSLTSDVQAQLDALGSEVVALSAEVAGMSEGLAEASDLQPWRGHPVALSSMRASQ